nr:PREDICTED: glioma tumor suppressor candidate region gene 2 protein-like [Anolis carolinensis]|eukprot:XP_008123428.1 PREDICTED: glioma tumor suppressor candidate region gene 2 protein-like [Anolis carolinensis]
MKKKPSNLPAVEVIAPGGSYNPSFQSHQALLLQAHEVEVKRQKAEDKLERQLSFPTAAEAPTQETVFQEQCERLLEEESDNEERQEGPLKAPRGGPARRLCLCFSISQNGSRRKEDRTAAEEGEGGQTPESP